MLISENANTFNLLRYTVNKKKYLLFILSILFLNNLILPQSLNEKIDSLLTDDFFKNTQIGIDIFDLSNQINLYSKNEDLLLRPASTLKILTTAASLFFLEDYNFQTSIYFTGKIKDSVCIGDLYLVGGLDPDFTTDELDSLVVEIKNYGINKIEGNIYTDVSVMDSLFWGEGWMWDDDPYTFAAYLSALNINDNSIKIIYSPGEIGKPPVIKLLPETKYFEVVNHAITVESDSNSINIIRDWINRSNKILVDGLICKSEETDTLEFNVFDPAKYFSTLLIETLDRHGISHNKNFKYGNLPEDADQLFTLERSIDSVITRTNKESENLSAEMLLRVLGLEYFGKPTSAAKGIKLIDSLITIAGFNPENFRIADGSGLSFYNLVTPKLINSILKYFFNEEPDLFIKLYNSFPISAYDGTLKNRMVDSNANKKVRAKTGTLSGVSTLAGYMTNRNNHLIAFTIMIQNYVGSAKFARDLQDRICELIYNAELENNE